MKYRFLLSALYFSLQIVSAQKCEVLQKSDTIYKTQHKLFVMISDSTEISKLPFVSTLKSTGTLKNIFALYYQLKDKAQEFGANSFRLKSFKKVDNSNGELILDTYYANDSIFETNVVGYPKDKVFIFGNPNLKEINIQNFKLNGVKYEVSSGKYREFPLKSEIKINKGGFTGMTIWIAPNQNQYYSFISFCGIGIGGGGYSSGGGVGLNINTGRIERIEPNLGLLMLNILEQEK